MENPDLIHYIEQARKSGMGDGQIREGLLQAGWATADVEEAMAKAPAVSASQTRPKAMMSKSLAVIFITVGVGLAVYFAGAYYMSKFQNFPLWPFEVSVPVTTFTPRPSPIATPDPTVGWQTYINTKYYYTFKYPLNASILSNEFATGEQESFNISLLSLGYVAYPSLFQVEAQDLEQYSTKPEMGGPMRLSLKEFAEYIRNFNIKDIEKYPNKKVGNLIEASIDNKKAYQLTLTVGYQDDRGGHILEKETIYTFISRDDGMNFIIWYPYQDKLGDQILSTFRFIDGADFQEEVRPEELRNLRRRADIQGIWNDVMNRMIDNKNSWATDETCRVDLPSIPTYIGSKYADIYSCLTNPKHFYEKVFDPSVGTPENTGYTIYQSKDGKVIVAAPHAELGESISVTH